MSLSLVLQRTPHVMRSLVVCSKNLHMALLGQAAAAALFRLGGVPGRVPNITTVTRTRGGTVPSVLHYVYVDGKYQLRAFFKGAISAIRTLAAETSWCRPYLETPLGTLSLLLPLRKIGVIERGLAEGYLAPWEVQERFAKVEFNKKDGGSFTVVAVEMELPEAACKRLRYKGKLCPMAKTATGKLWVVAEDARFLNCTGYNGNVENVVMLDHNDPELRPLCKQVLEAAKRPATRSGTQVFSVESLLCEAARAPFPRQRPSMPAAAEYAADLYLDKLLRVIDDYIVHYKSRIVPVEEALIAAGLGNGPFPQLSDHVVLMIADLLKQFCKRTHGQRTSGEQLFVSPAIATQALPHGYMEAQAVGALLSPVLGTENFLQTKNFLRHLLNSCVYLEEVKMTQQKKKEKATCELRGVIAFRHGGTHNLVKVLIHAKTGKTFELWPMPSPALQAQRFTRVTHATLTSALSSSLELVDQDGNPTEHSLVYLGGVELGEAGIEGLRRRLATSGRVYPHQVLEDARAQQLEWRLTAPAGTRVILVNPFFGVAIGEGVVQKQPYLSDRLLDAWRKCIRVDVLYKDFVDPFAPGQGSFSWFSTSDAWFMQYPPGQSLQEVAAAEAEAEEAEVEEEEEEEELLEAQQGQPQQQQREQQQQEAGVAEAAQPRPAQGHAEQGWQQQRQQEEVQPEPQKLPPTATGPISMAAARAASAPIALPAAWLYYQLEAEEASLESGKCSTDRAQQSPLLLQQQRQQVLVQSQPDPQQQPQPQQQEQPPSVATTAVVAAGPSSVAAALSVGNHRALLDALAAEDAAAQATLQALAQLANEDVAASVLLSTAGQDTPVRPGLLSPPQALIALLPQPHSPGQPPPSPAALMPREWTDEWSPSAAALPLVPASPTGRLQPLAPLAGQGSPSGPLRLPAWHAHAAAGTAAAANHPVKCDDLDPFLLDMALPPVVEGAVLSGGQQTG